MCCCCCCLTNLLFVSKMLWKAGCHPRCDLWWSTIQKSRRYISRRFLSAVGPEWEATFKLGTNPSFVNDTRSKCTIWANSSILANSSKTHSYIVPVLMTYCKLQRTRTICPWDRWTCILAATYGRLHIIQWCRKHDCPRDECECAFATENGHFQTLQFVEKEFGVRTMDSICVTEGVDDGNTLSKGWNCADGVFCFCHTITNDGSAVVVRLVKQHEQQQQQRQSYILKLVDNSSQARETEKRGKVGGPIWYFIATIVG